MCSTGPFQFRWLKGYTYSPCYYHHWIGSIQHSHCYHIFPWLHAWDVCYITSCHLLQTDTFWLAYRIRLFVHHTISLSSLCKLIWRHWTYKMPVRYFIECASKIMHILLVIQYTICGALCVQFTHFPCDDCENEYFVFLSPSNRRYEALSIVDSEVMKQWYTLYISIFVSLFAAIWP